MADCGDGSTEDTRTVSSGCTVGIHYTLTDDTGLLVDTTRDQAPFTYVHGEDDLVLGLVSALEGRAVEETFEVCLRPEEAFGEWRSGYTLEVPTEKLFLDPAINLGSPLAIRAPVSEGTMVPLWVSDVHGDTVTIDFNHPLAGQVLHMQVHVVSVERAVEPTANG